jgi:hypothetical protein
MQEVEDTIEDGFRILLIDRGVALIVAYHAAGETDEAFDAFRRCGNSLAVAAARLGQNCEWVYDPIIEAVGAKIDQMYDEGTAERLMLAFECGLGRSKRPVSRRA